MADIGFYHLTRTELVDALAPLLARTLRLGRRATLRCATPERLTALDAALWLNPQHKWLPHGTSAPEFQPIFLTTADSRPNGADFLFLLDGTDTIDAAGCARIFDLFDGRDATQVAAARERWRQRRTAGHDLTYWRQTDKGWEKSDG